MISSGAAGPDGDRQVQHLGSDGPDPDRRHLLAHETAEEAADAILDGLEYLVREAHAAGLRDLAQALTGVILSPSHWPHAGHG